MLSQDRCSGMDSGRGPGLSQHSLPAGDLLDARLAFMFSRTAQRIGSASVFRYSVYAFGWYLMR